MVVRKLSRVCSKEASRLSQGEWSSAGRQGSHGLGGIVGGGGSGEAFLLSLLLGKAHVRTDA